VEAVLIAVAAACVATLLALGSALLALRYQRGLREYRWRHEAMAAEHHVLYAQTLVSLDAATDALAAAEAEWRQSLERIQRDYDDSLERLRIRQATALARLQVRLPQPDALRLHGDEKP
jgi:hypothetical protein